MTVYEKIEAQQKGHEGTTVWTCGEQLKSICRSDPHCAQIVAEDLENDNMSIVACEKKIKAYADKQSKSNKCVGISADVAENIIREFYGLPSAAPKPDLVLLPRVEAGVSLDLSDLLGGIYG